MSTRSQISEFSETLVMVTPLSHVGEWQPAHTHHRLAAAEQAPYRVNLITRCGSSQRARPDWSQGAASPLTPIRAAASSRKDRLKRLVAGQRGAAEGA
jgi:hypothetical protein